MSALHAIVYSAIFCIVVLQCDMMHSGNISETGNAATVAGIIYETGGTAPASGVTVIIRDKYFLPAIGTTPARDTVFSCDSVITDTTGRFHLYNIREGDYVISALRGNEGAMIQPVFVKDSVYKIDLAPDTLEPLCAIRGTVVLEEGERPQNSVVLVFGVNRYADVDSNGTFLVPSLPEGVYTIKVLPGAASYESMELSGLQIQQGDTLDIGIVKLLFSGIPKPKNVTLTFDTVSSKVTLTWNRGDTSRVKHFIIEKRSRYLPDVIDNYRSILNDIANPYSGGYDTLAGLLTDTIYHDPVLQDNNYIRYNVIAVDKNGNMSTVSDTVNVCTTPPYIIYRHENKDSTKSYPPYLHEDIATNNNLIYLITKNTITAINSLSNLLIAEWGFDFTPKKIAVDASGTIFVVRDDRGYNYHPESAIYTVSADHLHSGKFDDSTIQKYGVVDLEAKNGLLYVITGGIPRDDTVAFPRNNNLPMDEFYVGGDSVIVFTFSGERVRAWESSNDAASRWLCINNSAQLFVSNGMKTNQICIFDTLGNRTGEITIPPAFNPYNLEVPLNLYPQSLDYDEKNKLLFVNAVPQNEYACPAILFVFNHEKRFLGRFVMPSGGFWVGHGGSKVASVAVLENGTVVYMACDGAIARGVTQYPSILQLVPEF